MKSCGWIKKTNDYAKGSYILKYYEHEKQPRHRSAPSLPLPVNADQNGLLVAYLKNRGLNGELALENGWYVSMAAGDGHNRIVIPCTNSRNRIYWQARAVLPWVEKRYQSPPYAQEDSIVLVWPYFSGCNKAVIVEGPMDALAAADCGFAGVAIMGNRPSRATLDNILQTLPGYTLTVVPDLDAVGAGALTVAKLALKGATVRLRVPVCGKDLSRMPKLAREKLLA